MNGWMLFFWLLSCAAGVALGHRIDPEARQRRLDAASLRARRERLVRVQRALLSRSSW